MRIVAFILTILGGLNWLGIGMLQYDFVAGIFGTQANIFSRLIYAVIGIASVYTLFIAISKKGKIFDKTKKQERIDNRY